MVAPAALLTTAENFTESCLLRGTLTDLIGRMTVCCYLTLFGLSGAPPMLELLLRQVRISECSGDALEVEMTVAELPVELRAFLVHSRRGRQRLAQLLDLLERLGLLWRQRAPLRSHASLPSADGAAAGAHRKRSGSQRQSAAAENDEAAANFDGVLLHKYAAAVLPTADRQPPTAEFSVHAAAIAAAAGVADTSSATIGHVGPGEWFALSGSEGRAAYWEALRRACSGSRGRKRDSTERSIMGVLHVTQRGEATAAAEIEGAAHPSSHSNGAADTRGSKLLLQDLDWTGVRPLYAEQRMRLERELPRDQPTGAASLCDLAERVEVHPQQLRAWYAALARRASSNSAAPCAPAWIGIPGAGDESEGTAGEACAATGEACAGNSASLAAAGAHACDGLSLRVEPSGREGSQMSVPWDAAAQCTLLSCFAEEVVRLLTERDPVLRMKIQHAHEDPLRVSTDVVGQYVRWEDVALRVGRPAASCRALLRRVLLAPPTQGLQLRRQLALVALQHLRAHGIRDQRPAPARSAARHAQQILNALGVGLEQHGSTRASELGAAAALPSRMLALHERVKLLLGASENDYRPSLGLQLLRPFTREETDAAFQQLTRLGWIARQKEKHTQCQRRFKLSARYHEQLTPPMPDAAARAVMEGTAALFEGEEAEVPQAADARSALVAFERVARGDVDLSATSAVDTAAAAAEGGALVAKPPEEDHGAGPVGLPAERKRKRHGQGVRFHLLQGMLEARRRPAYTASWSILTCRPRPQQARSGRAIAGAQFWHAADHLMPEVKLHCRRTTSCPGGWGGDVGTALAAGSTGYGDALAAAAATAAMRNRCYSSLGSEAATSTERQCEATCGAMAQRALSGAAMAHEGGIARASLERLEHAGGATGWHADEAAGAGEGELATVVAALESRSLLASVAVGRSRAFIAHVHASCWLAAASSTVDTEGGDDADVNGPVGGAEDSAGPACKRALGSAAHEGMPPAKRPCIDEDTSFIVETGRTLSGAVDGAHYAALSAALLCWISCNPGITDAKLLSVAPAFSAAHVREVLAAMVRHELVEAVSLPVPHAGAVFAADSGSRSNTSYFRVGT